VTVKKTITRDNRSQTMAGTNETSGGVIPEAKERSTIGEMVPPGKTYTHPPRKKKENNTGHFLVIKKRATNTERGRKKGGVSQ